MALQQEMILQNGLNVNLYRKVIFYDFRAGVITLGGFPSEEIEKLGKPPIETFKYSHSTEEYRYEEIMEEKILELSDSTYPTEIILEQFDEEIEIEVEKIADGEALDVEADEYVDNEVKKKIEIKRMKRVQVPSGKTKRIKNEDYIGKTGYLLIKLYRYLKEQNEFADASDV